MNHDMTESTQDFVSGFSDDESRAASDLIRSVSGGQPPREIFEALTDFIFADDRIDRDHPPVCSVIFVPGNGYPQPAEEAAFLYCRGAAPAVLTSGRFAIGEAGFDGVRARTDIYAGPYATECDFLEDVLVKNGVPRRAVLREDRARFTYENALNSRRLTDRTGIRVKSAILCCLASHARRCQMYYRLAYPDASILVDPVPGSGITRDNWMMSERGIRAVCGEAARCGSQFEDILSGMTAWSGNR